jgi:hypothetical protein
MFATFPGGAYFEGGGTVTSVYTPSPYARSPVPPPFPILPFLPEPTLRAACLEGLVLGSQPPNEQIVSIVGLLLRPVFGYHFEILYSKHCNILVSRYLYDIWYFCFIHILYLFFAVG